MHFLKLLTSHLKELLSKKYGEGFKNKVIDNTFCDQLNRLTLEELISLKLLLSAELVKGKLFGFPIDDLLYFFNV